MKIVALIPAFEAGTGIDRGHPDVGGGGQKNLGFAVSFFAFLYIVVVVLLKVLGINERGWTTLMGWILLLGGVQLLMIGVLGEYLGRIYDEVKGRPLYLVAEEVGGNTSPAPDVDVTLER